MSLVARLLGGHNEVRAVTSSASIPKNSEQWGIDAGSMSERQALQFIAVQSCVRLLGESVASLPMNAYRKNGDVRTEVTPAPPIVADPVPDLTGFDWKFQLVASLALRGNSYHQVVARDRYEYPTALLPIHPDSVQVSQDPESGAVVYRVGGERIAAHNMLHIRRFTMPGWVEGLSPIGAARVAIGIGLDAERYGARYFKDSANPSAVLQSDENLTADQVERTQRSWVDTHGGRRLPAVLSGGLKYQQIQIAPAEAQFLETREFQRGEIAMLFGIPPHMIGDTQKSTSWGTGIEQQSIGFVQYTLRPWLSCIEDAWTRLLPRGQFVKFNIDALLRGDQKSRYDAYTQARMASWLSVNEIRAHEDLPPIPDGDTYIQPLNYGPLGAEPPVTEPAPDPLMGDDNEA